MARHRTWQGDLHLKIYYREISMQNSMLKSLNNNGSQWSPKLFGVLQYLQGRKSEACFPFSHSPFQLLRSWFKKLAHGITTSFSSPLSAIKQSKIGAALQAKNSMGMIVYKEFSQACKSCPKKYCKLLIKSVCNTTGPCSFLTSQFITF